MRWKLHEHISALKAWYGLSELWLIWRMWWYWLPPLAFICLSIRRHVHIQFTNRTWNERCAAEYTVDEIALKFKHHISTLIRSVLFSNQFQQLHFTSELSCAPCAHAAMRRPEECARFRDINNNSLECFQSYCGIVCAHRCIHLRYTQPRTESMKSFSQISVTKAEIELKHNIVDRDSHSSRLLRNEWSNVRTKWNKIEKQNTLPEASDEEMG